MVNNDNDNRYYCNNIKRIINKYYIFNNGVMLLFFFRSQKTSHFQKTSGLHALVSGLSLDGLSAGQVLGFSANPRTIEKFRKELADNHPKFAAEQISKGTNVITF